MSVAANRYARALVDALYPSKAEAGREQLLRLNAVLDEQPDARRLFENPTVPADRRKAFLKEIGDSLGFSAEIKNFEGLGLQPQAASEHDRAPSRPSNVHGSSQNAYQTHLPVRACRQLSQTTAAARWTAARKLRAILS